MQISVKIDSDSLVEMLIKRLAVWTSDKDTIDAFRQYQKANMSKILAYRKER